MECTLQLGWHVTSTGGHQLHEGGEDKKRTALVNILHPLVRGTPSDRGPLPVTKRPV